MEKQQNIDLRLAYATVLLMPLCLYFLFVGILARDLPIADDYGNILLFMINYTKLDGQWLQQLKLIFAQNFEHRNAFSHLVYLLTYHIHGQINFYLLIIIGNLAVALLCLCYARQLNKQLANPFILLIIMLLVLQPQSWGNMLWAMGSIANHYVLLFGFLALWAFSKGSNRAAVCGAIFAFIATNTQGNGVLVYPAIMLLLLLQRRSGIAVSTTAWLLFLLPAIFVVGSYIDTFNFRISGLKIKTEFDFPFNYISHFFAVLGGSFGGGHITTSIAAGILFFFVFVLICQTDFKEEHPVFFGFLVFLVLSTLAVSASRGGLGLQQALSLRYRLISSHVVAMETLGLIWLLVQRYPMQTIVRIMVVLATIFSAASYIKHTPDAIKHQQAIQREMENWLVSAEDFGLHLPLGPRILGLMVITTSLKKGLYQPFNGTVFKYALLGFEEISDCQFQPTDGLTLTLVPPLNRKNEAYIFKGSSIMRGAKYRIYSKKSYLILCSDRKAYKIPLPTKFSTPPKHARQPGTTWQEFELVFPRRHIEEGIYQAGIILEYSNQTRFAWSSEKLVLGGATYKERLSNKLEEKLKKD